MRAPGEDVLTSWLPPPAPAFNAHPASPADPAGRARPCWVHLDRLFPHPPDRQVRFVAYGLDLRGRVPGLLLRWQRSAAGAWLGVVRVELRDGAGDIRIAFDETLVPAAALSRRDR